MSAKPATPLPWYENDGRAVFAADTPGPNDSVAECMGTLQTHARPNAAYIVHAANAYPRLVAALRDLASAVSKIQTVTEADQKAVALPECRARALLAKLGEL